MYISRIFFKNYRNFTSFDQRFNKGCNIIVAPNGSGKTNILESIQVLSLGKSLRSVSQIDLINHDMQFAYIKGKFEDETLDILIKKLNIGQRITKTFKRNEKNIRANIFSHHFVTLWFSAETMNVVNASSSVKREFIDNFISSIDKHYSSTLKSYKETLHQKNLLLTKNEFIDKQKYVYFNGLLIKYGSLIIETRSKYISKIQNYIKSESLDRYIYEFEYLPSIECDPIFEEDIEKKFLEKFENYKNKEMLSRRCLIGPHKDSWRLHFTSNSIDALHDLGTFGSRGQKRIGVLNMLICFMKIIEEETGKKPVLLLDDITSELDSENIRIVESIVQSQNLQSFLTTTNDSIFDEQFLQNSTITKLLSTQDHNDI